MADIRVPSREYEGAVLGWLHEAVEEAEGFLKAQTGYDKIDEAVRVLMSQDQRLRSPELSQTGSNRLAKAILQLVSYATDVKPFWEYRTNNKRYEKQARIYGNLSQDWYLRRMTDLALADAIKYSAVGGSGWLELKWNPLIQDLEAEALDPRDVLPIRPAGPGLSVQGSYGVMIRRERTVNYVKQLCHDVYNAPGKADLITPDRDGFLSSMLDLAGTRTGQLMQKLGLTPFQQRLFGERPHQTMPRIPVVDVFSAFISDQSRSDSTETVYMGPWHRSYRPDCPMCADARFPHPAANWSYSVEKGQKLYPNKRMIVATRRAVLYDGPSIYWSGLFPVFKLTLDPWPWTWLGKGVAWDLIPLQRALDKHLKVFDDWLQRLARPNIVGDKASISQAALDKIDARQAGLKLRVNPVQGGGVKFIGPDALPQDFWKGIEFYINEINTLSGVADISGLMKLNQMPSADTVEQILEKLSPDIRLRSRYLEAFTREFATAAAYGFAQFYTLPMRLTELGPEGATEEDFDLDPETMIPDFVHREDFDEEGGVRAESLARGPLPRFDRAREFLRQFTFHIAPGSMLAASEIQRKLLYLQLARAGLVDHWTLLEILGVPNVGTPPATAATITDRLIAEMNMGLGMNISPVGRKATGQTMPRMTVKES